MGTVRAGIPTPEPSSAATREGGRCGNCGFADSGRYCSRCGEPLHGTRDTVLQILWADLVEAPIHNLFALAKTTWLMLVRPRRFFDGVLRRQHGMTHVPFFLAPVWRRVSPKPHGVPNAVKYFVLIYTLSALATWAVGVNAFQAVTTLLQGRRALPGTFAEPLFLLFVVFAAAMYAKAMSLLLGGRIPTELLTRFMLYLNGFALIPFVGMSLAGTRHPLLFFACLALWLYAGFALPQLSLPPIFGVSRMRLGFAQAGAAVANLLLLAGMIFCTGVARDLLSPRTDARGAAAAQPADMTEKGLEAVRGASANVFPMDTVATLITQFPPVMPIEVRPSAAGQRLRVRSGDRPARRTPSPTPRTAPR